MPGDLEYCPVKLESFSLLLRLEIFDPPGYPGDRKPELGNRISGDTSSDLSSFRATQWLVDCLANHKCGSGNSNKARPTRLLHIGESWAVPGQMEVKLKDYPNITDKVTEREPQYACLSYCWGGVSDMTTTSANLYSRTLGIEWESLPKTFQHAIEFTRRMQINYLWIDALCIIQDDPEDWQLEAARMGDIYSNAFFTISAMTGRNNRTGLFSKSSSGTAPVKPFYFRTEGVEPLLFRVQELLPHRGLFFDPDDGYSSWSKDYVDDPFPLVCRAWVYQERLLSRRIVHFTPHELVWECIKSAHCECGQLKGGGSANSDWLLSRPSEGFGQQNYASIKSNMRWWHAKVEVYSKLDLTYSSDRLPALSGIAAVVQNLVGGQYLAGLFAVDLWNELRWSIHDLDGDDWWFRKERRTRRTRQYQGPSWSWVSLDGALSSLYFPHDSDSRARETDGRYIQVLEIKCTPVGLDPRGQVSSAHMILAGFLAPGLLRYPLAKRDPEEEMKSTLHYRFYIEFEKYKVPIFADYPFDEPGPHHIPEYTELYCLRIGKAKWEQRDKSRASGKNQPPRVPVLKTGDLLVLRRIQVDGQETTAAAPKQTHLQQPPRRISSRDRNDNNNSREEMHTYERVALLWGFSTLLQGSAPGLLEALTEEADEDIFEQVERSVFKLV